MSFSANVKEELSKINTFGNIELIKAELYGYMLTVDKTGKKIKFLTENEYNINRLNKLLNKLEIDYKIKMHGKSYLIEFNEKDLKLEENKERSQDEKKAIVRGAFLGSGSITEPSTRYNLEIKLKTEERKRENHRKYKHI